MSYAKTLLKTAPFWDATVSTASFLWRKLYAYTVNILWSPWKPELRVFWCSLCAELSFTRTLQSVKFLWMCLTLYAGAGTNQYFRDSMAKNVMSMRPEKIPRDGFPARPLAYRQNFSREVVKTKAAMAPVFRSERHVFFRPLREIEDHFFPVCKRMLF